MTEALLTESKEKPAGRLKVTTTVGFGSSWLAPRLVSFLSQYPDVTMQLLLDDADLDLAMREADVAIRMHPPKQPDLVQRHLMAIEWHVVASPAYLQAHGTPIKVEDLDNHKLVLFGRDYRPPVPDINWLAEAGRRAGNPRRGLLEVNNLRAMLLAGEGRARDRGGAGLHACRHRRAGAGAGRCQGAEGGRVFRLSGGAAQFQAGGGVSRLPAGQAGAARLRLARFWRWLQRVWRWGVNGLAAVSRRDSEPMRAANMAGMGICAWSAAAAQHRVFADRYGAGAQAPHQISRPRGGKRDRLDPFVSQTKASLKLTPRLASRGFFRFGAL